MPLSHFAYQTRRMTFSACHRLNSTRLSEAENKEVYGKCNHVNGHGHNYVVEVSLYGPVEADTGMIMNLTDLKRYMERTIMSELDHKNLDADVEWFKTNPSTTENVAIYIWERMKAEMGDKGSLLRRVRIYETENNIVTYTGDVKDV